MKHFKYSLKFARLFVLTLSLTLNYQLSFAEEISYEEVLSIALEQSPSVKQIEQSIALYNAESKELTLLNNPELSIEVRPFTAHPSGLDVEHEIAISQPLKLSNFGARQKVADLISATVNVESKMLLVTFEQNILLAYSKVWALQEREIYLAKLIKRAESLLSKVESASTGGLLPVSIKKLIQAEQKRLKVERDGIFSQKQRTVSELINIVGSDIKFDKTLEPKLQEITSQILEESEIPLIQRIKAKTTLAIEQRKLASLDAYPQFSPRVAFDHTADGDDRVLLGFTVALPLYDRNQPEQIRASAEESTQLAMKKYVDNGALKKEIELLVMSANSSLQQAQALKNDVIPTLEDAYSAAEHEVFSGQGSPLQLWQVLTEMRDLQERSIELWTQSLSHRASLIMLTGKSF